MIKRTFFPALYCLWAPLVWAQDGAVPVTTVEDVVEPIVEAVPVVEEEVIPPDPIQHLRDREAKVQEVFKRVSPSIVALGSVDKSKPGWGSGVIVNETGLVLTAGHVTEATGEDVEVYLADGRVMLGKRLGANMNRDASMLQIVTTDDSETFPYVDVAEADTAVLGEWVVAMGHPGGYDPTRPAPLRVGRVIQKQTDKLIVTDCTLSGGDSGGALFDLRGRLIGINSSIGQSLSHNMHVAMAVFHRGWDRMLADETWGELTNLFDSPLPGYESKVERQGNRALLGANLDKRSRNGVLVREVRPDFPAAEGGLRAGDVIVGFDGQDVTEYTELFKLLSSQDPGDEVELRVKRRGKDKILTITMGDRAKLLNQGR